MARTRRLKRKHPTISWGRGVKAAQQTFNLPEWVRFPPALLSLARSSGGESGVLIRRRSWVQLPPRRLNTNKWD